jgi:hypothetical protein
MDHYLEPAPRLLLELLEQNMQLWLDIGHQLRAKETPGPRRAVQASWLHMITLNGIIGIELMSYSHVIHLTWGLGRA